MEGPGRSVAFALNGGPGAASVFLNFGAIGPKHIRFGEQGDSPSDPTSLTDNPGTWLFHCHMPGHFEGGMYTRFNVLPAKK